jgi:hypothetical protein
MNKPLFSRDTQSGSFDRGFVIPASQLISAHGLEWLYYEGRPCTHESRMACPESIGLKTWTKDRILGLAPEEDDKWAMLETKVVRVPRNGKLHLNVNASREGAFCVVEAIDPSSRIAFPALRLENSVPITGDQQDAVVRWKSASQWPEKAIIRVYLLRAKLFSFWFT